PAPYQQTCGRGFAPTSRSVQQSIPVVVIQTEYDRQSMTAHCGTGVLYVAEPRRAAGTRGEADRASLPAPLHSPGHSAPHSPYFPSAGGGLTERWAACAKG